MHAASSDAHLRWRILALLFLVRTGMGLQFQIVPALSPLYLRSYGISVGDLGLLIGLYYAPGVALAYPGGRLGARYGDRPLVIAGLAAMAAGSLMMAVAASWHGQLLGRLIAGAGAILMNVMMSKMVTDWFAGRELATAMGIFVNSWPVGVALGLLLWPSLALSAGLASASLVVALYLAMGAAAVAALYVTPMSGGPQNASPVAGRSPVGMALVAVVIGGCIWGLYNAALAMVFGFGPLALSERGWSLPAAASMIGITLLLVGVSVPMGGVLADRLQRPVGVLLAGLVMFATGLATAYATPYVTAAFVALGLLGGLSAGAIMSLPARVLQPETRSIGMGIFFTLFYAVQMLAPWVAGAVAQTAGRSDVAFLCGVAMLAVAGGLLASFLALERRIATPRSRGGV